MFGLIRDLVEGGKVVRYGYRQREVAFRVLVLDAGPVQPLYDDLRAWSESATADHNHEVFEIVDAGGNTLLAIGFSDNVCIIGLGITKPRR